MGAPNPLFLTPPLVSIIVPAYNAAATLERCLEAIVGQSFSHWQLYVLNDYSADSTGEIAHSFARADARIRVIHSKQNRGVIRMRNLGIRLAQGDWLAFCDADDWWAPDKLQSQLALATAAQADLVYSSYYYVRPSGHQHQIKPPPAVNFKLLLRTNAIPLSTAIYHCGRLGKHYFAAVGPGLIHEDYQYWLQVFKKTTPRAAYLATPSAYYAYQAHSRSANKWLAARSHWRILVRESGVSPGVALFYFSQYIFRALVKRWPWRFSIKKSGEISY